MSKPMKMSGFTGAGYGQKAVLKIPVGPTYEEIVLKTNLAAAQLKRVTVNLNGDEIYILSGDELLMLEAYNQITSQAGMFVIPFSDISGRTKNGIRSTGLVTEYSDNITLEVEVASVSDPASEPAVTLEALAMVSAAQPKRLVIPKIRKQTMQASAQGENDFTQLVSSPLHKVRRMHFNHADITQLKIYRDNIKEFEATRDLASFQAKRNERTFQSGYYHFDPLLRGFFIDELFETAHRSELKFTVDVSSVAGSVPILVESVEIVPQQPQA